MILVELWLESSNDMKAQMESDSQELEIRKEKYRQFLKTEMNGQRFYIGKSLAEAHQGLMISNEKYDAILEEFKTCVKQINPQTNVSNQMMSLMESFRKDIVQIPDTGSSGSREPDFQIDKEDLFKQLGHESGIR